MRGVRASCEALIAFTTLLGTSLWPLAAAAALAAAAPGAGVTACARAATGVDTAPAASPWAVSAAEAAPSWLLRDCLFDSRLLPLLPPLSLGCPSS